MSRVLCYLGYFVGACLNILPQFLNSLQDISGQPFPQLDFLAGKGAGYEFVVDLPGRLGRRPGQAHEARDEVYRAFPHGAPPPPHSGDRLAGEGAAVVVAADNRSHVQQ